MRHENFFIITREIEKIKALSASYGLTTAHEHYRHNICVETREVKIRFICHHQCHTSEREKHQQHREQSQQLNNHRVSYNPRFH